MLSRYILYEKTIKYEDSIYLLENYALNFR